MFFALLALLFAALPARAGEPRVMEFDVAVVGAGCGGAAAAIQAARLGMEVAVVEESDWVGGQMTGGGVSTMDDVRRTRTGIYGEFLRRASAYYDARETPVNTCYLGVGYVRLRAVGRADDAARYDARDWRRFALYEDARA